MCILLHNSAFGCDLNVFNNPIIGPWFHDENSSHYFLICWRSKELQENSFQPKLHLQYLDLSASDATPEQLAEVLAHCPSNQLKKLSLESCPLSKDLVKCIANQGGSLEELNLCMSTGLKEDGVRIMFESCKRWEDKPSWIFLFLFSL